MKTEIDQHLGQPCLAYNVQIPLSAATQAAFAQLQNEVLSRHDLDAWPSPAGTLHVTVAPLVGVRYRYPRGPEAAWAERRPAAIAALQELATTIPSWRMRFHTLQVSPAAIFAVADDHGITGKFRAALRMPEVHLPPLATAHVTLFRFRRVLDLDDSLITEIDATPAAIEESVEAFFIMRETLYPSLEGQIVERFAVRA